MPSSPTASATAGPASVSSPSAANAPSLYSVTRSPRAGPHSGGGPSAYSSGYSSFPSAAQSPPTTASTMRPSLSGLAPASASFASIAPPPPRQPFPFSHDDTDRSRLAYETLSASAKAYRVALGQLSAAASNFGSALEACARLKEARAQPYPPGPYARGHDSAGGGGAGLMSSGSSLHEASCTADVLLATSGLYYLMANQQGILAETVYRSFELPIVHELDRYGADVEAEQESYAAGMRDASREIRRLEKEGVKLRKPRQRDVGRMRDHLVTMTEALDALTVRQGEHAVTLLDQSRDISGTVSQASRNLVRAEVDILDSLARKGWPGGGLDVVLDGAVDLFSRNGYDDDDDDLGGGGGLLLGGSSNGAGIVSSSSHAVVSGAGGFLGSGVGPTLSLLGGGGGGGAPVSSASFDDDLIDGDAVDDGDDEGTGIDDEASEVSTINGNVRSSSRAAAKDATTSSTSGGGGFFSILTGGSILGRKSEPRDPSQGQDQGQDQDQDQARGRSPRKGQRSSTRSQKSQQSQTSHQSHHSHQSHQSQAAIDEGASLKEEGEDDDDDEEDADQTVTVSTIEPPAAPQQEQQQQQQRYARADSLAVDSYQHQYQSLDSLAHAEATSVAGSDTASVHARGASASRRKPQMAQSAKAAASNGGRSRPFSPQRVSVDPQEDLFSGQFSSPERTSLAWLKEGEQLETPREEKEEGGVIEEGAADEEVEDELRSQTSATSSSRNKGKGKARAESGSTTPTSAAHFSPASPASRASSSSRPATDIKHEETDEGVYIWRQEV